MVDYSNKTYSNDRNIGIDILKIICMVLILILHFIRQGGIINNLEIFSFNYQFIKYFEITCFVAINCFALISGYNMYGKKTNYNNIVLLWVRVVFYSIIMYFISIVLFPEYRNFTYLIKSLFPIMTNQYWYFTSYFFVILFAPLITVSVEKISSKKIFILNIIFILFFSVLSTIFLKFDSFSFNGGYTSIWLLIVFFLGLSLKKLDITKKISKKLSALVFFVCVSLVWVYQIGISMITVKLMGEVRFTDVFTSYISPFILVASISLLVLFSQIRIKFCNIICLFSKASFSVYIIHLYPLIWEKILLNRFEFLCEYNGCLILLMIIFIAIITFIILCLIDFIRMWIFDKLKINHLVKKITSYVSAKLYLEEDEHIE